MLQNPGFVSVNFVRSWDTGYSPDPVQLTVINKSWAAALPTKVRAVNQIMTAEVDLNEDDT